MDIKAQQAADISAAFTEEAWEKVDRKDPGADGVSGVPGRRFLIAFDPTTPVLGSFYSVDGTPIPNFVLPSWYVPGSAGPWDRAGVLTGPQSCTPGGYYVADDEGAVHDVWLQREGREAFESANADKNHPTAIFTSKVMARAAGEPFEAFHEKRFAPPPAEPPAEEAPAKS